MSNVEVYMISELQKNIKDLSEGEAKSLLMQTVLYLQMMKDADLISQQEIMKELCDEIMDKLDPTEYSKPT
ncbi:hypothetical protein ABER75_09895 [Niallia taxi]|uniref:Uncharacterized protein n=1 Tax=Niallia taxi TaxID=2499688 RepID=A0A3S2X5M5_9BACI|nr:hypothetical protein [Niallia taxi]MCM3217900.1 hypothetical protein [Niallia taxi]MDK8641491.1 hypothetical protein [Niallia taxi]MED4039374.1 hypothetical protein [Niallia taxi]MED4055815.1 hypothetical protein [Niallia taxi]MED4121477.1 hypothetical protein [Niallia taxi]